MARDDPDDYRERLLVERLAALLGFEWVTDRFPGDVYPPYLLVVTALAVQYGVVDTYNVFVGGHSTVLDDPFSVISGIGLILAVAGSRWMRDQYAEAVADLRPSERGDNGTSVPGDVDPSPKPSRLSCLCASNWRSWRSASPRTSGMPSSCWGSTRSSRYTASSAGFSRTSW